MAEDKPISRFAQRFVARKLDEIGNAAHGRANVRPEFENNFVDGVLELAERIKRPDLRQHLMNEATRTSEYLRQVQHSMEVAIRKVVWNGPWTETDEGRTIRGAVGQTYKGEYRYAEVSLYQEHGPTGRVSFSGKTSNWNDKLYSHKEHAIFAAREAIGRTVKSEAQLPERTEPGKNVAAKYAVPDPTKDTLNRSITPPSRSRQ